MKNLFLLISMIALVAFACQNSDSSKVEEETKEAAEAMSDALQKEKQEIEKELKDAISKIDSKLEKLRNDLQNASADAKSDIEQKINKLEDDRKRLNEKLSQLGQQVAEGWDQFKESVRSAMQELESEIDERL